MENRYRLSSNFYLDEFIPKDVYLRFGENAVWFIDMRLVALVQFIRDHYDKPVTINNWYHGGVHHYSGFRPRDIEVGADLSQHRFGRAADLHIAGLTPEQIRADIKANEKLFFQAGLRAVEEGTSTWTHVDIREAKRIIWVPFYSK